MVIYTTENIFSVIFKESYNGLTVDKKKDSLFNFRHIFNANKTLKRKKGTNESNNKKVYSMLSEELNC